MVARGLARSRDRASELIRDGAVQVNGTLVTKPAASVDDDDIVVDDPLAGYVGRGAGKLLGALRDFEVAVAGRRGLDVGACTGGFTQVLLEVGAAGVVALDVGRGQLAEELRLDPRVHDLSGMHVKDLTPSLLGSPADIVVIDLSFISVVHALAPVTAVCAPDADALVLVKPQFEAGRAALDGRGVVTRLADRARAVTSVAEAAVELGWSVWGVAPSAVPGGTGNRESFLWLRRSADHPGLPMQIIDRSVRQDECQTASDGQESRG